MNYKVYKIVTSGEVGHVLRIKEHTLYYPLARFVGWIGEFEEGH